MVEVLAWLSLRWWYSLLPVLRVALRVAFQGEDPAAFLDHRQLKWQMWYRDLEGLGLLACYRQLECQGPPFPDAVPIILV